MNKVKTEVEFHFRKILLKAETRNSGSNSTRETMSPHPPPPSYNTK
jgi:hypothetical protein